VEFIALQHFQSCVKLCSVWTIYGSMFERHSNRD